ncbi:hypothetical protein [uncultured Phascolarctobacterium sp.]|uniref:hypothetical protein n=1 Tax=uncultured Phascolarctobacterium sp. TaxID=512296 RepID=UPI0027D948F8|nr:hypothetical protein [uncultured Phascolarctobacterium sp.]
MDIVKIQAEVINEAVNGYRAAWYEEGDDVYVTIDRTSIFRIPKEQYFLNLRKEQVQGIGRALKEFEYGEKQEAVFTNDMKNLKQVGTAIRLKTENYDVWLAEKTA